MDYGVYLIDIILQGGSRKHKGIFTLKLFDAACSFGFPVFDPLSLIEDDKVRLQCTVDLFDIIGDLFIICQIEERVCLVDFISFGLRSLYIADCLIGELPDLLFPLPLQ